MDFRAIDDPFRKPEVDDLFDPLTLKEREITHELLDFAMLKNLVTKYGNLSEIRCLEVTYKKRLIFSISWRPRTGPRINVFVPEPKTMEHDLLLHKIDQLDNADDIFDKRNYKYRSNNMI